MKCRTPAARAAAADSVTETRSTSRNCCAFRGDGCGTPTSCTNVSLGATSPANVVWSSGLPGTAAAPAGSFAIEPLRTSAPHHVPAREELGDQTLPDVAGAAGDEDV